MTDQRGLKPYEVEVLVDAGRDEVWAAVTQPPVLRQWFGWDYDELDVEIRHIFVDQATLLAPERMGWADGSSLEVTGDDERSRVRVARDGPGPKGSERYDAIEEGWRAFLIQLQFLLGRRPRGHRRTLYLTGKTTGRQALTLADGEWQRFGTRVASVVNSDGNLIVVASRLPLNKPSATAVEITVSTFGLDDNAFEELREHWAKRWAPLAADSVLTTAADPSPGSD